MPTNSPLVLPQIKKSSRDASKIIYTSTYNMPVMDNCLNKANMYILFTHDYVSKLFIFKLLDSVSISSLIIKIVILCSLV